MKIDSIQAVFPSRIVTNNDVLYEIEKHSKPHYEGNLSEALDKISGWLNFSGAQNRRWLSPEEAPIRCIKKAINQALEEANCDKSDVELLIYTGIGKGFLEPGQSYMVAKAMGMDHVICFDILDACMSWTRALHIAHSLLRSGQYAKIMIVNGEFNHFQDGPLFPHNFCLKGYEQLYWTFPSFTIGNASTATLLSYDATKDWEWNFSSRPDLADLCTIPSTGYRGYSDESPKIGKNGVYHFTSFGGELHHMGANEAIDIFKKLNVPKDKIKMIYPHASSKKAWEEMGEAVGVSHLMHHVYPEYGNLVSASVPSGIALSRASNKIQEGDQLVGWVGSAGMSFASFSFQY